MPKGGHSASGPPPDPNALRRDRDRPGEWVDLPAEGRLDPAPDFPLTRPTKREFALWEAEWQRPQAVMWEHNGQHLEVALYVRQVRIAESPSAPNNARNLVRQMMDSLGISAPGMARLRWRVAQDTKPNGRRSARSAGSARDRLQVVDGGA